MARRFLGTPCGAGVVGGARLLLIARLVGVVPLFVACSNEKPESTESGVTTNTSNDPVPMSSLAASSSAPRATSSAAPPAVSTADLPSTVTAPETSPSSAVGLGGVSNLGGAPTVGDGGTGGNGITSGGSAGSDGSAGSGGIAVVAANPSATLGPANGGAAGSANGGTAAAAGGASALDGGLGGSAAAANGCSAAFCEDFESGEFAVERWTTQLNGANSAEVQQGFRANGAYAAAFHYAGTRDTYAFALTSALPSSLLEHHFGRASVLLAAPLPDRHTALIIAGTPGFPVHEYMEVAAVGSTFQVTFVDLNAGGGEDYHSGGTLPSGRWFCLEWEFNDEPSEAKVFVDGVEVFASPFTFNGASSDLVAGFSDFGIGFRQWGSGSGDAANDLYYDDIALDAERIGCP